MAIEEPLTPVDYAINAVKIIFAISPLLALAYVLYSAFEPEEVEKTKRSKKADFNLEGHAE
eukprot:CAMPEP_0176184914 /NCGR_PEP_ID=MMETSP0121_2-20121125/1071_1 /TAXON_ID=160619 /ORGANISM="Kryptoperidinium foliaceum, Strain CCMP 1326" /LENGTH=60 /DNA_ID=CAMNT_0017523325 /DNA_START=59 /DNA_END=241 /DNA_ORIENTATION=+